MLEKRESRNIMELHGKGDLTMKTSDLNIIEIRLQKVLHPVKPRAEFVRDLKDRLLDRPEISLDTYKPTLVRSIFLASAGILSGAVLLVVGIKTVVSLSKKLNVVSEVQKKVDCSKTSPVPTTM
jgi:hypothetical protein